MLWFVRRSPVTQTLSSAAYGERREGVGTHVWVLWAGCGMELCGIARMHARRFILPRQVPQVGVIKRLLRAELHEAIWEEEEQLGEDRAVLLRAPASACRRCEISASNGAGARVTRHRVRP